MHEVDDGETRAPSARRRGRAGSRHHFHRRPRELDHLHAERGDRADGAIYRGRAVGVRPRKSGNCLDVSRDIFGASKTIYGMPGFIFETPKLFLDASRTIFDAPKPI